MADEQDVFIFPDGQDLSTLVNHKLQSHSSSSLPEDFHSSKLHTVTRSRRPLSYSETLALQNILVDSKNTSYWSSQSSIGRSNYESGFFSDSPGLSNVSLNHISELQEAGVPEQHELDYFNKNEFSSLFNDFAEELGGCWKETGRYLLKKACSVENIDADYGKVREKAYQMLVKWHEENGGNASVIDLFKGFNHIGKEDVAEKVLEYLPVNIANACEKILLSSPKKIRASSMVTVIHNIKETFKDLTLEKQLRVEGDNEEISLCTSKITGQKYILKGIEEGPDHYSLAARLAIPAKQFILKSTKLRKTSDFLKEMKIKEDTVRKLKEIVEHLQSKLQIDYFSFCKEHLDCSNCDKTKTKLELLEKELSLLHHTLEKMLRKDRRISFTGIPTDRIYELADRTYGICEDHKKMHSEITKIKRRCSQETLGSEQKQLAEKFGEEESGADVEDPLKCTLNILQHFARKRQVVQSLTAKRRKESKAVQRNKSDKSKSRFFVPVRQSFLFRQDNHAHATTSGKKNRSPRNKDSKLITRKKAFTEKPATQPFHPRTNTSPAALVCMKNSKTDFVGPEDLDLDDLDDKDSLAFRVQGMKISRQSSSNATPLSDGTAIKSTHKKIHKSNSDPYAGNVKTTESLNVLTREPESHADGVFDIDGHHTRDKRVSQKRDRLAYKNLAYASKQVTKPDKSLSKSHSFGAAQSKKPSSKRDWFLSKDQSDSLRDSSNDKPWPTLKRDGSSSKSQSDYDKPDQKCDQGSNKTQSNVLGDPPSGNPKQKCDHTTGASQSQALEVSRTFKANKMCDQVMDQSESQLSLHESKTVLDTNNNPDEVASDVKWLKNVDTENVILV